MQYHQLIQPQLEYNQDRDPIEEHTQVKVLQTKPAKNNHLSLL